MEVARDYPLELGWAYLLLAGYFARVAFAAVRLPGAVGVLVVGFVFANFMQRELLEARDDLQRFAFFLVLLNAGFEVSVKRLRWRVVLLSVLPAALELLAVAAVAVWRGMSAIEGLVLGCVLFPLGEGLVIPKMAEFRRRYPDHHLPAVTLMWAPLEATLALALFGFLSGVAGAEGEEPLPMGTLVFVVLANLMATVLVGALVGAGTGWLLSRIVVPEVRGRPVFTGTPVEAFLVVLGVGLAGFGASQVVPMGVGGRELLNPDLLVIAIGSAFADTARADVVDGVENFLSSMWVFGSIILFGMLGSRTSLEELGTLPEVLPYMAAGLAARVVGLLIASATTRGLRRKWRSKLLEVAFFFLCCLPRATLQGALGSVPVQREFFSNTNEQGAIARDFVSSAAKSYIVVFSVVGSVLLELLGPKVLEATARRGNKGPSITVAVRQRVGPQRSHGSLGLTTATVRSLPVGVGGARYGASGKFGPVSPPASPVSAISGSAAVAIVADECFRDDARDGDESQSADSESAAASSGDDSSDDGWGDCPAGHTVYGAEVQ